LFSPPSLFIMTTMVVKTRLSQAKHSRPDRSERLENAARRCRVKKSIAKAEQDEAFKELLGIIANNGGKLPYGAMNKLVSSYNKNGFKSVTRDSLYYRLKKNKFGRASKTSNSSKASLVGATVITNSESQGVISEITDRDAMDDCNKSTTDEPECETNKGGRKKGTTKAAKAELAEKEKEALLSCASLYKSAIDNAKKKGLANVPNGTLKAIVLEEEEKFGLPQNYISLHTIRSRVSRGNLEAINLQQMSPISAVEPIICEFCIRLAKMGKPLTKTTVIELANDIVADTEYASKIADFKKLRKLNDSSQLGSAWYRGFISRYEHVLTRNKTTIKDIKRRTWVRRENFENMYENIYNEMVEAGIAEELEEEISYEKGLPSKFRLTHPDYLLFVDETGCNTNQLNDGKVGGEVFIMPKCSGDAAAPAGATTDIHFTVLPFISGTGEPVLCAIIFKSELDVKDIPLSWKFGIDLTVKSNEADNMGKIGKGGPTCIYKGKEIPCFYGTSPKASITSRLLADMLKFLDTIGIYDRTVAKPFLLLDGHHSRMMLPFLKYVCDPNHKWHCCFGVPYATHIWQVADASALNGSFKIELAKAKRKYVEERDVPKFEPTDIVPLVNAAFPKSFGNNQHAVKAIAERGWNPLNYNSLTLLPTPEIVNLVDCDVQTNQTTLPSLNFSKGSGSYYLDKLIEEEKKDEGRKKRFEAIKSEQKTKMQKIEHLKTLTKVSSASLAAHNHYTLDENVMELVLQKEAAEQAAKAAAQQRKQSTEAKRAESLNKAVEKFVLCPNGLTVPEMKLLVTAATNASDSPPKKKKDELKEQLYRQPRYNRVQQLAADFRLTMSSDAAAALIALQGPATVDAANLTAV
jgi:hypothetical protein